MHQYEDWYPVSTASRSQRARMKLGFLAFRTDRFSTMRSCRCAPESSSAATWETLLEHVAMRTFCHELIGRRINVETEYHVWLADSNDAGQSCQTLPHFEPSASKTHIHIYTVDSTILLVRSRAMHFITYVAWSLLTSVGVSADDTSDLEQQPIQPPCEDDVFDPSFDIFVEDTLRELHIPGLSIAVVDNGKIASKVAPPQCRPLS